MNVNCAIGLRTRRTEGRLSIIAGGIFDPGDWENHRSALHHDDFHYRFYHYLSKAGAEAETAFMKEIAAVLAGKSSRLPDAAMKAFKHWPGISSSLWDLFERALREATTDPEAMLARMAITEVGKRDYPESIAVAGRERAERVLAECAARSGELVGKAIEEPRRLVKAIDEFVALFTARSDHPHPSPQGEGGKISGDEVERHVRDFLDNVRRLDRALSDIPRRLRGELGRT